ncbi:MULTISPECIES: SMI1/KNR4 family protein [Nocardiaceae]|uniref:Cell wall assembly regulator SMI1 n=1 Tax=Rhodococcoides corynebacterioides TaxID=53972 RepID=A0ABS2KUF1_9NOCA|nr:MULTISPECIES: SMI1/KNR4 family protein [Rhodococcus]MBM7415512.1 cell wall assembly regulator SMI1 [Rhodococcus corynebacterioides]MBP1117974.1 cell wall assembly regulator SMI1 [Rhodococcus sp. PvP016]
MTLTEVWSSYMALLRDRYPATAESVLPPRSEGERRELERATTPWSDELREFFTLHSGQRVPTGTEHFVGTVLPHYSLLTFEEIVYRHKFQLEHPFDIDDLGEEWPSEVATQEAGDTAYMFLPEYMPIAEDGAGGFCYVDTRSGPLQGCVRLFGNDSADEGGVAYESLADYIDAVRLDAEGGTEHDGLVPTVEQGALIWEVDFSDRPPPPPTPPPTLLRLPFAPTDFRPSQWTDDDDIVDLDAVRSAVIAAARDRYPGAVVEDARAVYQRVPRQRGANMNWWLSMSGTGSLPPFGNERIFTAFITGEGDDVIVVEAIPGGYTIEVVEDR